MALSSQMSKSGPGMAFSPTPSSASRVSPGALGAMYGLSMVPSLRRRHGMIFLPMMPRRASSRMENSPGFLWPWNTTGQTCLSRMCPCSRRIGRPAMERRRPRRQHVPFLRPCPSRFRRTSSVPLRGHVSSRSTAPDGPSLHPFRKPENLTSGYCG